MAKMTKTLNDFAEREAVRLEQRIKRRRTRARKMSRQAKFMRSLVK